MLPTQSPSSRTGSRPPAQYFLTLIRRRTQFAQQLRDVPLSLGMCWVAAATPAPDRRHQLLYYAQRIRPPPLFASEMKGLLASGLIQPSQRQQNPQLTATLDAPRHYYFLRGASSCRGSSLLSSRTAESPSVSTGMTPAVSGSSAAVNVQVHAVSLLSLCLALWRLRLMSDSRWSDAERGPRLEPIVALMAEQMTEPVQMLPPSLLAASLTQRAGDARKSAANLGADHYRTRDQRGVVGNRRARPATATQPLPDLFRPRAPLLWPARARHSGRCFLVLEQMNSSPAIAVTRDGPHRALRNRVPGWSESRLLALAEQGPQQALAVSAERRGRGGSPASSGTRRRADPLTMPSLRRCCGSAHRPAALEKQLAFLRGADSADPLAAALARSMRTWRCPTTCSTTSLTAARRLIRWRFYLARSSLRFRAGRRDRQPEDSWSKNKECVARSGAWPDPEIAESTSRKWESPNASAKLLDRCVIERDGLRPVAPSAAARRRPCSIIELLSWLHATQGSNRAPGRNCSSRSFAVDGLGSILPRALGGARAPSRKWAAAGSSGQMEVTQQSRP